MGGFKICRICGEELSGGIYESMQICPICGDIVDDIVAKYLELVAKKCSEGGFDKVTYEVILEYLEEIVEWVEYFEELDEYSSNKSYYERFRLVLDWLKENREPFETLITENFKICDACGADFSKDCIQIEREEGWVRVHCGSCGALLSKYYSPKMEL